MGILVDGSYGKHMEMIKRWVYNFILMFKRGSYVSISTFGESVNLVSKSKSTTSMNFTQNYKKILELKFLLLFPLRSLYRCI